ncbi:MAG: hypothetical protein KAW41_02645 [Candidatus Diapherotrites archaeon]|nr:hypothetical protein [Candidatus Diapherotrites archaeon]
MRRELALAILLMLPALLLSGCLGDGETSPADTPAENATTELNATRELNAIGQNDETPPEPTGERHLYLNTADTINPDLEEQLHRVADKYAGQLWAQELNVSKNCRRIKDFYSECIPGVEVYAGDTLLGTTNEMGLIDVYDFFCAENFGKEFQMTFVKDGYSRCISPTTVGYYDRPYKGLIDLSSPGNNTFKCPDYMGGNVSFYSKNSHTYIGDKAKLLDIGLYPPIVTIWQDDTVDVTEPGTSTGDYSVYIMVALCENPLLGE